MIHVEKLFHWDDLLTLEILDRIPSDSIFAMGTFLDSRDEIPLCYPISNKEVKWIAYKGQKYQFTGISDWSIFCENPHYEATEYEHLYLGFKNLKNRGDRIRDFCVISALIPSTLEVYERYRF
jgi:hypothetical protein